MQRPEHKPTQGFRAQNRHLSGLDGRTRHGDSNMDDNEREIKYGINKPSSSEKDIQDKINKMRRKYIKENTTETKENDESAVFSDGIFYG